jgi:hypothetical protein
VTAGSVWLRRVAFGLLVFVLTAAGLTARVVAEGEDELGKSDRAFDQGDLRDAILHARRAAILYAPGAPHVGAAYERLAAVAVGAESSGQSDVARQAWDAMRGAAIETRHFLTPRAAELDRANSNLARLSAAQGSAGDRERMAQKLARDDSPRAPWILVLGLGFVLFSAGLLVAVRWGISEKGRISGRGLLISAAVSLAGVACWTLAVYRA